MATACLAFPRSNTTTSSFRCRKGIQGTPATCAGGYTFAFTGRWPREILQEPNELHRSPRRVAPLRSMLHLLGEAAVRDQERVDGRTQKWKTRSCMPFLFSHPSPVSPPQTGYGSGVRSWYVGEHCVPPSLFL